MKTHKICVLLASILLLLSVIFLPDVMAAGSTVQRDVLPPPPPTFKGKIGKNYKESTPDFGPALPLKAPDSAPNILLVVLDDVAFGQLGSYGSHVGRNKSFRA
jgi:hypothetical protein